MNHKIESKKGTRRQLGLLGLAVFGLAAIAMLFVTAAFFRPLSVILLAVTITAALVFYVEYRLTGNTGPAVYSQQKTGTGSEKNPEVERLKDRIEELERVQGKVIRKIPGDMSNEL